jgi:hypothetical protein
MRIVQEVAAGIAEGEALRCCKGCGIGQQRSHA